MTPPYRLRKLQKHLRESAIDVEFLPVKYAPALPSSMQLHITIYFT